MSAGSLACWITSRRSWKGLRRITAPLFNGERFLSDKELSDLLRISRRCLQDYRDQGRISYIRLGGKILYKVSDIEKLLEDNYHEALI